MTTSTIQGSENRTKGVQLQQEWASLRGCVRMGEVLRGKCGHGYLGRAKSRCQIKIEMTTNETQELRPSWSIITSSPLSVPPGYSGSDGELP